MDINTFCTNQIELIRNFNQYWIDQHSTDPNNFPLEISEGQWSEQFLAWLSVQ